jgi:hypothetical protein
MKQADLAELKRRVEDISKDSALGSRIKQVEIEADEDGEGGTFLRVLLFVDHSDDLDWDNVEPLVTSIEDSVGAIDERFPSVRFADAA